MRHSLAKQHDYVKPGAGQKRKFLWDQGREAAVNAPHAPSNLGSVKMKYRQTWTCAGGMLQIAETCEPCSSWWMFILAVACACCLKVDQTLRDFV